MRESRTQVGAEFCPVTVHADLHGSVRCLLHLPGRRQPRALKVCRSRRAGQTRHMDLDGAFRAATETVEAMWATDPEDHLFRRDGWPRDSCERVAVAVAAVLEDRGFGQWAFVSRGRVGGGSGHAWLEWRGQDAALLASIDLTLHQFDAWAEPFMGRGPTPATKVFTEPRWEGVIWKWPYLGSEQQTYRRLICAVRDRLDTSNQASSSPA